jgi:hypothetical protein
MKPEKHPHLSDFNLSLMPSEQLTRGMRFLSTTGKGASPIYIYTVETNTPYRGGMSHTHITTTEGLEFSIPFGYLSVVLRQPASPVLDITS